MELEKKSLGEIKIDNGVIGMLAKNAALQVEGVIDIVPECRLKNILAKWRKGDNVEGVLVNNPDEYSVAVTLKIVVQYGYNVLDVARKIQVRVGSAIRNFANLEVDSINIIIQEVVFNKEIDSLPAEDTDQKASNKSDPEKGE